MWVRDLAKRNTSIPSGVFVQAYMPQGVQLECLFEGVSLEVVCLSFVPGLLVEHHRETVLLHSAEENRKISNLAQEAYQKTLKKVHTLKVRVSTGPDRGKSALTGRGRVNFHSTVGNDFGVFVEREIYEVRRLTVFSLARGSPVDATRCCSTR